MTQKTRIAILTLAIVLLIVSLLAIAYPVVSSWFTARHHSQIRTEYQKQIADTDEAELAAAWTAAQEYNEKLYRGESPTGYDTLLDPTGTGIMGYVEIPKIKVNLPIYHSVSDSVLAKGAGHMPQTSLPVGGANTHAAISAHTGLASAPMFTELERLEVGDVFYITVLDTKMAYEVDQILVVKPADITPLQIQPGEDLVTLITCTPYGVNSHRLLVRGKRVPLTEEAAVDGSGASQEAEELSVYWRRYLGGILDGVAIALAVAILVAIAVAGRRKIKERRTAYVPRRSGVYPENNLK